ncbi:GFA family protein [Tateyamaria omphalii]|uniref:GFA family protein n=1 Tax=Tateyamaria omphalii TaxID=299262 RepID=UPI001C995C26|nr:GFA family protein [Tateyamaria omphalii]MBY5934086.1 GFA family protein [Tateyamaria omphalii]
MPVQTTENKAKGGGCYCGAVRYAISERPTVKGQCHCRACQYIAGGAPQYFMLVPVEGFSWTQGRPVTYTRPDLDTAVTRHFCGVCGTHLATFRQDSSDVVVKAGTLDDPSRFAPHVAICHAQAQPFHNVPDGIPVFEDLPAR